MSSALLQLLPPFAGQFRVAFGTNLALAGTALALGLPVGLALGLLRLPAVDSDSDSDSGARRRPRLRRAAARVATAVVALLRAAPTFVVMYVLLQLLPAQWPLSAPLAVAAALAVYAAAYVADNLLAMVCDQRAGARGGTLLFVMALARAWFVMVLSSGFGAAVGVTEATAVTLRALEQLPTLDDRLALVAVVVGVFVALRQALYAAIAAVAGLAAVKRRSRE